MLKRLGLGAALVALLWSCEGALFNIRVSDTAETTIRAGTVFEGLLQDFGFGEFVELDITSASELQNQGVGPGDIVRVTFQSFDLEVISPEDGDLSFLDRLEFYVEAPELPRELVARADAFPDGQARVSMELIDIDLTDYVVSESMTISTEARGSRPRRDTTVEASFALRVGVTGQGACNHISGGRDSD